MAGRFGWVGARRGAVIGLVAALLLGVLIWQANEDDGGRRELPRSGAGNPEPVIEHVPVATANHGQSIRIDASATCRQGSVCTLALLWRTTPDDSLLGEQGGWTRADMTRLGSQVVNDREVIDWSAQIPGTAATTRGVDYFLEAQDGSSPARSPISEGTLTNAETFWHVHTVSPPLLTHLAPAYARTGDPVPLELGATCSTGNCDATVFWRITPPGGVLDDPVEIPQNAMPSGWNSAPMELATTTDLGDIGDRLAYAFDVPADDVDTRGLDYFFHVTDGETSAYWPGSTYQGYYAPAGGQRVGYQHVRVVESPKLTHATPAAVPYRQSVTIEAEGLCETSSGCEATLWWRTTTAHLYAADAVFSSTPMTVEVVGEQDGADLVQLTGTVPATATDTRGVDYFFNLTDGETTAWWPGTPSEGGYVPVPGTRVAYHHLRVIEPPHITPVLVPAVPADQSTVIETLVTCATEACDVTLHYTTEGDAATLTERAYRAVPMTLTGPETSTPIGREGRWRATIPAEHVTTSGLAYYIHAEDGYTQSYAPGSDYWGAYIPVDGSRPGNLATEIPLDGLNLSTQVGTEGLADFSISTSSDSNETTSGGLADVAFPVRVLEPPHPVHIPPLVVTQGKSVPVEVYANCSYACKALLRWSPSSPLPEPFHSDLPMQAARVTDEQVLPPEAEPLRELGDDLWVFRGELPAVATTSNFFYKFLVSDGHATGETPAWYLGVSRGERALGAIAGRTWLDTSGDGVIDPLEPPLRNIAVTLEGAGADGLFDTLDDKPDKVVATDAYGFWIFDNLLNGKWRLTVDEGSAPEPMNLVSTAPQTFDLRALEYRGGIKIAFAPEAPATAPAGTITVNGAYGVDLTINSNGGIRSGDVEVSPDPVRAFPVSEALASETVFDLSVPPNAPAFTSATVTIPYLEANVPPGVAESDLRIHHFDKALGLWEPVGGTQTVDTTTNTVTATVSHFSSYAVLGLGPNGFEAMWTRRPVFCLQDGAETSVGWDVVLLLDKSGSTSGNGNEVADGALAFVNAMRNHDRAAVVTFQDTAHITKAMTSLSTGRTAIVNAINGTRNLGGGGTDVGAGVQAALNQLTGTTIRARLVVLISDGDGSYEHSLTDDAHERGIVVHTLDVAPGDSVELFGGSSLLESIAANTGGEYHPIAEVADIATAFGSMAEGLVDDGSDGDSDGLTDCEERFGMLGSNAPYSFWTRLNPFSAFSHEQRVVSDPELPDSDDDGLDDGQEMGVRDQNGNPITVTDLRDSPLAQLRYPFLIQSGVTRWFDMFALPTDDDTDDESVLDAGEFVGVDDARTGDHHDSEAFEDNTDTDAWDDYLEYAFGTNPRAFDGELPLFGLQTNTLFVPKAWFQDTTFRDTPQVFAGFAQFRTYLARFGLEPVIYDSEYDCVENCFIIDEYASTVDPCPDADAGFFDKLFGRADCKDGFEIIRDVIRQSVERQGVFDENGALRGRYFHLLAAAACANGSQTMTGSCEHITTNAPDLNSATEYQSEASEQAGPNQEDDGVDAGEIVEEILFDEIADRLMYNNVVAGQVAKPKFRPDLSDLCGKAGGGTGVYQLVRKSTNQVLYVGRTSVSFKLRELAHRAGKFKDLAQLNDLEMRTVYVTGDRTTARALEQFEMDTQWGVDSNKSAWPSHVRNGRREIALTNQALPEYKGLANYYRTNCNPLGGPK